MKEIKEFKQDSLKEGDLVYLEKEDSLTTIWIVTKYNWPCLSMNAFCLHLSKEKDITNYSVDNVELLQIIKLAEKHSIKIYKL